MVANVKAFNPDEWAYLISRGIENFHSRVLCDIDLVLLIEPGRIFLFLSDEESEAELLSALRNFELAPDYGLADRSRDLLRKNIEKLERLIQAQRLPPTC